MAIVEHYCPAHCEQCGECTHPWNAIELTILKERDGLVAVCTVCLSFLPKPSIEFTTIRALVDGAKWAYDHELDLAPRGSS